MTNPISAAPPSKLVLAIEKVIRVFGKILGFLFIRRKKIEDVLPTVSFNYLDFSERTVATAEAATMAMWPKAKNLQSDAYRFPKIFTTHLTNVTFCGAYNTLLVNPFTVIRETISTVNVPRHRFDLLEHFKPAETIPGVSTTFRSVSASNFYHSMIDSIPRVYLLHDPKYKQIKELKLLCSDEVKGYEKFFLDKLLPDNVTIVPISKKKNYKLEEMIFPSFLTRDFAGILPQEYIDFLIERVAPARSRRKDKRIFIARATKSHKKKRSRIIHNQDELFSVLAQYGFQKYYLEHMTIEEQIELFYDAEFVVAGHGAGLTNLIFSDNIGVVELYPTPYVVPYFYFTCKSRNHAYYYWCGTEEHRDSNFSVDINAVEDLLKTCLKQYQYS